MSKEKNAIRGVLAGVAGGMTASWLMNQFLAGPGAKLRHAVQSDEENIKEQAGSLEQSATMKTADAVASATSGRHLSWEQQEKAAPVVHYTFGALLGGLYGGLVEYMPPVKAGFGTAYGSAVFGAADMVAVPAFNLSGSSGKQSAASLVSPFSAHVVYGVTTELVRRIVRAIL